MRTTNNHSLGAQRALHLVVVVMLWAGNSVVWAQQPEPGQKAEQKTTETNAEATARSPSALAEEPGEYNNWITFGAGHHFVSGDDAQFKYRKQIPDGFFGGIEDLHFEQAVGKRALFQLDGRGIFDNHDYSLQLGLSHPDKGFIRGGYRQFRTWYDGSAGFSPNSNAWVTLYNEELALDRGEAWVEGGITIPDWPVITLKYAYLFREGKKDSTTWGDYNLNIGTANPALIRGIVPTFWAIDENRHIIEGNLKHTLGKTDLGVGLVYELSDNDNSRNIHRRPGETADPPGAALPPDRYLTQKEGVQTDLFNAHASSETRFTDQVLFSLGYSFTTMDTDISGSRIYGLNYDPIYDPNFSRRQQRDEGFLDLGGGAQLNQHVANINLMYTPRNDLALVPSVRIEEQNQNGVSSFTETDFGAAPAFAPIQDPITNRKKREFIDLTEGLEARYTGIKKWSLYARGEWTQGQGDLDEREREAPSGPLLIVRETELDRLVQKYTAGANWYPHQRVNLAGQYYYKIRQNDYDHEVDSTVFAPPLTNDFYPAFIRQQDFQTHDVNFRVSWRPLYNVTLVSRYDFQFSTIDTEGGTDFAGTDLSEVQSAEMISHIFSQSASWTPFSRLSLQGSISYVLDETETPANHLTGAAEDLVLKAENNYWNANVMAGFVLSQKTDLQATYFYYRSDNYEDNSTVSLPYGAGAEEHGVTASILHRLRKNILWKLTYGFFTNHDRLYGGFNDYTAHLVYSSVQVRF